jgi:hypothetical protein
MCVDSHLRHHVHDALHAQVVLEGPGVNTAITGPAAATALMMMYLKTGDADVAAMFRVGQQAAVWQCDRLILIKCCKLQRWVLSSATLLVAGLRLL